LAPNLVLVPPLKPPSDLIVSVVDVFFSFSFLHKAACREFFRSLPPPVSLCDGYPIMGPCFSRHFAQAFARPPRPALRWSLCHPPSGIFFPPRLSPPPGLLGPRPLICLSSDRLFFQERRDGKKAPLPPCPPRAFFSVPSFCPVFRAGPPGNVRLSPLVFS